MSLLKDNTDQMTRLALESPCIKVCAVDGETGYCLGCGRTLVEIGRWASGTDEDRRAVMDELPDRLEALRAQGKRT